MSEIIVSSHGIPQINLKLWSEDEILARVELASKF